MNTMRTKGVDFDTNFSGLAASNDVHLPLARMQEGMFETISSTEKKAIIFDGYSYRVTVESHAGDNNQNYSTILENLLIHPFSVFLIL